MQALTGKAVIVTGAGRGIGRAVALHAAAQGASVLVNDVDSEVAQAVAQEVQSTGGQALALAGSVCDWAFAHALVDAAVQAFGRLDGLVNNAALHYEQLPWDETPERIRSLVDVNVLGPMFCGMAALRHMVQQGAGSIVNVSSAAHLGVPGHGSYGATKGAVASLTYGWAVDTQAHGVRVNAVAPLARTRMTDTLAPFRPSAANPGVAEPELLAPLFSYLLSDASQAIHGQLLRFNGQALSVMQPPRVSPVAETREVWDMASLHAALSGPLQAQLQVVGLAAQIAQNPLASLKN